MFGGGARGDLKLDNTKGMDLGWYAQFILVDEDLGDGVSSKGHELIAGVVAKKMIDSSLTIYGGIELVPLSDFEAEDEFYSVDVKRSNKLGFRFGADYSGLLFSVAIINETTFMFGISRPLM